MRLRLSAKDEQRLWDRVDAEGDCWEWIGPRMRSGHGRFYVHGGIALAHRVMWEFLVGPIPEGLHIDHLCINPPCVNPDHLEPVTNATNVRRGKGPFVRRGLQTHCHRGHPFDKENTYVDKRRGTRMCRACHAVHESNRRRRLKENP